MLCTSGFVDDVIFSHDGENGPESMTTRVFRLVRRMAAPGAKSVVSDCILFLGLVGYRDARYTGIKKTPQYYK